LHGINNTWEFGQYIIPGRVYDAPTMLPNKGGHKFPVFRDRIDSSHFIVSHQFTVTNNVSMKDSGELSLNFFIIHSHFTGCLNFKKIKGNHFHHVKIAFSFMIIKHKKQPLPNYPIAFLTINYNVFTMYLRNQSAFLGTTGKI